MLHPAPTSANDGLDPLQLAQVVFFLPSTGTDTSLALVVAITLTGSDYIYILYNCTGGGFSVSVFMPNVTEAEQPFYSTKTTASADSFSAIISCEILDFELQLSVCVDGIIEGEASE